MTEELCDGNVVNYSSGLRVNNATLLFYSRLKHPSVPIKWSESTLGG